MRCYPSCSVLAFFATFHASLPRSCAVDPCLNIDMMTMNEHCKYIDVSSRHFKDVGASTLGETLRDNRLPNAQELYLWDNDIGAKGMKDLAQALVNTKLQVTTIFIQTNRLRSQGGHYLCEALKHNGIITEVNAGDNDLRGNITAFASMLSMANSTLQHLSLADNDIFDQGAAELADALKLNTNLQSINLANNRIGDKGAQELAEALKLNPTLTTLDLSGNPIWDAGARAIADALQFNTALTDVQLDELAEAYAISGSGHKAAESRRLSRKVRMEHERAIEQGKTLEDTALTLNIKPATAAAIHEQLKINQNPSSALALEKQKKVLTKHPCAGHTSRQLCHSRGYPAERAHDSDYGEVHDGSCTCAPCMPGFTGRWCELIDVCLARTRDVFCGGHGDPVVDHHDGGICKCAPCFQMHEGEGVHGYHGDQCERRACNASDIFSKGGGVRKSSSTNARDNKISIPLDCTELNLQDIGMRSTGCAAFVDALVEQMPAGLTRISLQNNFIGKAGAARLGQFLATNNHQVKTLELQWTPIYNLGASSLLAGLKLNTVLTRLDLFQNTVDDESLIREITAELAKNKDERLLKEKKKMLLRLKDVCKGKAAAVLCHGKGKLTPVFDNEGPFCGCTDCDAGYSGAHCQIHKPCYDNKDTGKDWCYGHGTPEVSEDGQRCTCSNCAGGFTGARCEKHDPCFAKTRASFCNDHGAVHVVESQITGSVRCECHECDRGFSGPRCGVFDACFGKTKANLCFNRGTPTPDAGAAQDSESSEEDDPLPKCICTDCMHGYSGQWCSTAPLCRRGTVALKGTCVEDCPVGLFATEARVCEACNKHCRLGLCTGSGPGGCDKCKTYTRVTLTADGEQTTCVEKCADGEASDEALVCHDAESNPARLWALQQNLGDTFASHLHEKHITLSQLASMSNDGFDGAGILPFSDINKLRKTMSILRDSFSEEYLELLEEAGLDEAIEVCTCTTEGAKGSDHDTTDNCMATGSSLANGGGCEFGTRIEFKSNFMSHPDYVVFHRTMCLGCSSAEEYDAWRASKESNCEKARKAVQELARLYHPPSMPCNFPYCARPTMKDVKDDADMDESFDEWIPQGKIIETWLATDMIDVLRLLLRECRPRRSRWH